MKEYRYEFEVKKVAKLLGLSRSGFYHYNNKQPSQRAVENVRLSEEIKNIHERHRGIYGSPRVHAELKRNGENCSRKRVARLMREQGLKAKTHKAWKVTIKRAVKQAVAPNLIEQNFVAFAPNQIWMGDITYIATEEGWLYLAVILDLFSRKVVGLCMENRMQTSLVIKALKQALNHRDSKEGLIHHSDRGSQYTSEDFKNIIQAYEIKLSMSSKGHCYDNAVVESFFHTLKTEHVNFHRFRTREEAKDSIFEYIEIFYNKRRSHSSLGYLSPQEFEKVWLENDIRVLAV